MSEMSRRRRWLGRTLVGASALALPLTASISYANAQPAPPAPPAPLAAELPPAPPAPPAPPEPPALGEADQRQVRTFVLRREGTDGEPAVREFALRRDGAAPIPPMPKLEFHAWGNPADPEFDATMETFEREMESWSREMQDWGEKFGEQFAAQAEAHALAFADAAGRVPEVVESCDPNERSSTTTSDGRPRVVICQREITARANAGALAGLRGARAAIAHNRQIGGDVQREILDDLDDEIERLERDIR